MPQISLTMTRSEWEREQLDALKLRRARRQPITEADACADLQRRLIEAAPLVNARAAEIRAARAEPLPPERVWIPPRATPGVYGAAAREREEDEEREDADDLVTELGGAPSQAADRPEEDEQRAERRIARGVEALRRHAEARTLKLNAETSAAWSRAQGSMERLATELGVTVATARERLVRAGITPPPRPAPAPKPPPPSKPAKEPKASAPAKPSKEARELERRAKQETRRARVAAIWEQAERDLERAAELLDLSRTAARVLLVRHGLWRPTDPEEAQRARTALGKRLLAAVQSGKTVDEARVGEDISRNTAYKLLHDAGWESGYRDVQAKPKEPRPTSAPAPATPRPAAVTPRARAEQPKLDVAKLHMMRRVGVSLTQLAIIYDRTPEQIAELLKEQP